LDMWDSNSKPCIHNEPTPERSSTSFNRCAYGCVVSAAWRSDPDNLLATADMFSNPAYKGNACTKDRISCICAAKTAPWRDFKGGGRRLVCEEPANGYRTTKTGDTEPCPPRPGCKSVVWNGGKCVLHDGDYVLPCYSPPAGSKTSFEADLGRASKCWQAYSSTARTASRCSGSGEQRLNEYKTMCDALGDDCSFRYRTRPGEDFTLLMNPDRSKCAVVSNVVCQPKFGLPPIMTDMSTVDADKDGAISKDEFDFDSPIVQDQMRRYGFTDAELAAKDSRIWDLYKSAIATSAGSKSNANVKGNALTLGVFARVEGMVRQAEAFNLISTGGVVDPSKFVAQAKHPVVQALIKGLVDLSLPLKANG